MNDQGDKKHKNSNKDISRRDFLKYTGAVVFVVGAGCYVPADKISPVEVGKAGLPASDGYLLVDTKKCQGCISCMLACTLVHEGVKNPSLSRIQIIQNSFESFPDEVTIDQCRQCVDPACVEACPEDALKKNYN